MNPEDEVIAEKQNCTLDIIQLYLSNFEKLNTEERKWITECMKWLSSPVVYVRVK